MVKINVNTVRKQKRLEFSRDPEGILSWSLFETPGKAKHPRAEGIVMQHLCTP